MGQKCSPSKHRLRPALQAIFWTPCSAVPPKPPAACGGTSPRLPGAPIKACRARPFLIEAAKWSTGRLCSRPSRWRNCSQTTSWQLRAITRFRGQLDLRKGSGLWSITPSRCGLKRGIIVPFRPPLAPWPATASKGLRSLWYRHLQTHLRTSALNVIGKASKKQWMPSWPRSRKPMVPQLSCTLAHVHFLLCQPAQQASTTLRQTLSSRNVLSMPTLRSSMIPSRGRGLDHLPWHSSRLQRVNCISLTIWGPVWNVLAEERGAQEQRKCSCKVT